MLRACFLAEQIHQRLKRGGKRNLIKSLDPSHAARRPLWPQTGRHRACDGLDQRALVALRFQDRSAGQDNLFFGLIWLVSENLGKSPAAIKPPAKHRPRSLIDWGRLKRVKDFLDLLSDRGGPWMIRLRNNLDR